MNSSFAAVVEEVKNLSVGEKLELQNLLEKYLLEAKRQQIYENYQASRDELEAAQLASSSDVNALRRMLDD